MIAHKWQPVEGETVIVFAATESPAERIRASPIFFVPSVVVLLALARHGRISSGTALSFVLLVVLLIVANYWLCLWDWPAFAFPRQIPGAPRSGWSGVSLSALGPARLPQVRRLLA